MLMRHVLADGTVRYFLIDELPREAGGGFHAMVTTRDAVVANEGFQREADAHAWLDRQRAERLRDHVCGSQCHRLVPHG
jgi:hypothetical protein